MDNNSLLKIHIRALIMVWVVILLATCHIKANEVINLNGVKGKDISRLFDGNLTTSFNVNNVGEPLAFPYESYIILDSLSNFTQFSYYTANSVGTQGFTITFLDHNRNQIGSYLTTSTIGKYQSWTRFNVDYKGVMFIRFQTTDLQVQWDGITEVSFIKTNIGKSPSIYPIGYNYKPVDMGVYAHGVNILGDRINKVYQGDTVLRKVAKSARFYWVGTDFDVYPQTYFDKNPPLYLGRYGFNHSGNLLNAFKRWDIKPMMNKSGGGIKWLSQSEANQNNIYLGGTAAQVKKYITPGSNPEIDSSWSDLANQYKNLIQLYGKGKGFTNAISGDTTSGQGQMDIFEWDNEPNRWWQSDYYHSPRAYYNALSAVYAKGKAADAKALIYAGALPGIDTVYWKAVYFVHYLKNGLTPFPADGFNFNMYLNDGDQQREGTVGLSPEKYGIFGVLNNLRDFFNRHFGKPVQWTEFGYATDAASPYDVPEQQTQASYSLRLKAICQAIPFVSRMYYYAFFEDGTGPFNSMGLFRDSNDWKTVIPSQTAFALAQELYIERNSTWFSEVVKNGGDTGLWITKKGNLLKLWHPSGSVNYPLQTPSKVYKIANNKWLPDSTVSNVATVDGSMTWIEVSNVPIVDTCFRRTIKAVITTKYYDSASNKLLRTTNNTIYLR
jgi:hypothetical protein